MKALLVVTSILGLLAFAPHRSGAQIDVPKVLVGKWEGQVQVPRTVSTFPDRTLVIKSVREQEGKWLVEARFGVTGGRLEPVDVTLKKEYLAGSFSFPAGAERRIRLKKAE